MKTPSWISRLWSRLNGDYYASNRNGWRKWHQKNSGLNPIGRSAYDYDAPVLAALDNNPSLTLLSAVLHEKFPHPEPLVREKAIVEVAAYLRDESSRAKLAKRLAAAKGLEKSGKEIAALLPETLKQLLVLAQKEDSSEQNQRLAASFLEKPLSREAKNRIYPKTDGVPSPRQSGPKVVRFREPPRE